MTHKTAKLKSQANKISPKINDDTTPEIRTLISGVIFMTKYTKEIKLAIYHEWIDDDRRGAYLSRKYGMRPGEIAYMVAYEKGGPWLHALKACLLENRNYLAAFLADKLPQIKLASEGATYLAWLDVSAVTDDSAAFAQELREKTGLIVNPGTVYGGNGSSFIRLNLAYPKSQIEDALQRLQDFLTAE